MTQRELSELRDLLTQNQRLPPANFAAQFLVLQAALLFAIEERIGRTLGDEWIDYTTADYDCAQEIMRF